MSMNAFGDKTARLILNAANSRPEKQRRRPTVLVVEDDIVIRSPLAEYLRSAGYTIVEAANTAEAIAVFEARLPIDVVFSDIRMPGPIDGLGLARWVRQHHAGVRVVLTSGAGNASRAGKVAEIFLPKPYQAAAVATCIAQLLGRAAPATGSETAEPTGSDLPPGKSRPGRRRSRPSATGRSRRADESQEFELDPRPEPSDDDEDPVQKN
jgi:CheY-like chemotaxis protein